MVIARSCALTAVVLVLAPLLKDKENPVCERLLQWCYDARDKTGLKRQQLEVRSCFTPLLKWVLSGWQRLQLA